jgi:hypothetical protein
MLLLLLSQLLSLQLILPSWQLLLMPLHFCVDVPVVIAGLEADVLLLSLICYFSTEVAIVLLLVCYPASIVLGSRNAAVATYPLLLLFKLCFCCYFYPAVAVVETLLLRFSSVAVAVT